MVLFQLYDTQKRCIFQHLNVNFYVFFTFKKIYIIYVGAEKDNSLPCAALFSNFSESKCGKILLCLAGYCLFLARKDNLLPCTTLYTLFSESKKRQKIFAAQTPQRKRGYAEDFAHQNHLRLQKLKNPRFTLSTKLCCEIAARQARGWGWYLIKIYLSQL